MFIDLFLMILFLFVPIGKIEQGDNRFLMHEQLFSHRNLTIYVI